MPFLTLFLVAVAPLAVEWFFSSTVPTLWRHPRWFVLPVGAAALGWWVPMEVLPALPMVEHVLSAFLGLVFGLLVALLGHFRQTFWTGPSEEEVARTGRRSAMATTGRMRR